MKAGVYNAVHNGQPIILSRVLVTLDAGLDWRIDLFDIH
jgi:hypothetical protein